MKPDSCLGCPLYDAPGLVPGFGPTKNVKLMLVGEAPGANEALVTKRPFTGGSGRVLDNLLRNAGIVRSACYTTNVVKCRPTHAVRGKDGNDEIKDRPPTPEEIRHCAPFLLKEIEEVNPNLIVALGATALLTFKDTNAIGKHRGVPFWSGAVDKKILATFHPAALMRMQHLFPLVFFDLQKAVGESQSPELVLKPVSYNTNPSVEVDGAALLRAARESGYVVIDWETTGGGGAKKGTLNPRACQIVCAGIGTGPYQAESYTWTPPAQQMVLGILADPSIAKVGQNSESFDWPVIVGKGYPELAGETWDTLLMHHLVNPDLPKDLNTISSMHTDMEYWKTSKMYKGSFEDLKFGNCKDVDATARDYLSLRKDLRSLGLEDLYIKSVMPLQKVLRAMWLRGIKKDAVKAAEWGLALEMAADQKEEVLRQGMGVPDFNVNSSPQVMDLLYNKLGLPVQYTRDKVKGMRPTANAEALDKLAEITQDPIFHLFNDIRTYRKYKATYMDCETDENDFIHPMFGCAKAGNGRLNSWAPNAQNWPAELREIVIPDTKDHVFLSSDWNQVEWRVAMAVAGDKQGLEMFATGRDMHKVTSVTFNGCAYEDVTDDQRHQSKFIVYGWAYGRGARSIAVTNQKEESWVKSFIRSLERTFPQYCDMRKYWEERVRSSFYLRNPFSRRRWWFSQQVTEIYNFIPSSTPADMMYLVLPVLERQLPKGATLRLTVHDEVVVCSHRDVAKEASTCMVDIMHTKFPQVVEASMYPEVVKHYYPTGWYVPADVNIGRNWRECKPKSKEEKATQLALQKEYLS